MNNPIKKSEKIANQIIEEIDKDEYGESGNKFMTVQEICSKYDISNKTALSTISILKKREALITIGYHSFILNGIAKKTSPLIRTSIKKNKTIGFHVSDINNTYYTSIITQFTEIAGQNGYDVLLCNNNKGLKEEFAILNRFVSLGCSGVVTFPSPFDEEVFLNYNRYPLPIVNLGLPDSKLKCNYVTSDSNLSSSHVADHLYSNGYNEYCYVGINPADELRCIIFIKSLNTKNIPNELIHILNDDKNLYINLFPIINKASINHKIGIFCFHDLIATKVYELIKKCFKDIPNEVGVIGFDNLPIVNYLTPKLTSNAYSFHSITDKAFQVLDNNIKNLHAPQQIVLIPTYLSVKGSSTPTIK